MGQKKKAYSWTRVKPGNIISFKYKSKSSGKNYVQTLLVLNPKLMVTLKDGTKTKHLIGIKLEQSNKITLRLNQRQISLFEKIGDFVRTDEKNNLYALEIDKRFILNNIKGVKPQAYEKISKSLGIQGQYRTYDWMRARKSAVYLEPIRVFTDVPDVLQDDEVSVPPEPKKPEQPKKPKTEPKKPKELKKPETPDLPSIPFLEKLKGENKDNEN